MLPVTTTILGMYKFQEGLFDELVLPNKLNKQDVIDSILLETCELETMYPRFETMQSAIGIWSRNKLEDWQRLYDVLYSEYNPIWNKDGVVTEKESTLFDGNEKENSNSKDVGTSINNSEKTDKTSQVDNEKINGEESENEKGTNTTNGQNSDHENVTNTTNGTSKENGSRKVVENLNGSGSESSNTMHNVAGFNDDSLHASYSDNSSVTNSNKQDTTTTTTSENSGTNSQTETTTSEKSGTNSQTENKQNEIAKTNSSNKDVTSDIDFNSKSKTSETTTNSIDSDRTKTNNDSTSRTFEKVEQGNIGITTTQSMILEEVNLRLNHNVIDYIVQSFKERFCLSVY